MTDQTFKIGAVSKLTGVPAVTIRMWERRHNAVTPQRTPAGSRLYTRADVDRIGLLKRAIDSGDSISTLARLSTADIEQRIQDVSAVGPQSPAAAPQGPIGCCVIGREDFFQIDQLNDPGEVIECLRLPTLDAVQAEPPTELPSVDALIVQADLITPEMLRALKHARATLRASAAVVVYRFATRAHLDMLDTLGASVLRGPAPPSAVVALCRSELTRPRASAQRTPVEQMVFQPIPQKRFSREALAWLAQASGTVKCECPEHLALLIENLSAFEDYSQHCENENRADAAVHMMLHAVTAQVRRYLEDALHHVIEHEQITVPPAHAS